MPKKFIWLLRPTKASTGGPSVVVRAACEQCARSAATADAGAEGTAYWRDPERTSVVKVVEDGKSGLVLRRDGG